MTLYLDENLKPRVETIEPKYSESYILEAFGLKRISSQSFLISVGNQLENFWNKVISDSERNNNLIEEYNMVTVAGKLRQVDHFFDIDGEIKQYLESKCNLNFDSEKIKESNRKIGQVKDALGADHGAYFVPVVREIDQKDLTKYNNKGLDVYGVRWLLSKVDAQFTEDDYFNYLKDVIAPILVEKGL
mgnify:FL=1|tara:strand:+ start:96 stop:659 length:564 start_codon:yes stop_codon:yes gene_type:complete